MQDQGYMQSHSHWHKEWSAMVVKMRENFFKFTEGEWKIICKKEASS